MLTSNFSRQPGRGGRAKLAVLFALAAPEFGVMFDSFNFLHQIFSSSEGL